jgi:DNA-binding transcriptional LysR family regulator
LTAAGEAFLAEARAILAQVEAARDAARRAARGETGRLGIGFTSSASFHPLVPRAIRAFREDAPLVALSLEESGTGELVEAIRAGRIDAAFVRSPIAAAPEITIHSLLQEAMIAVLPAGHPLAAPADAPPLTLAELAAETFILYRRPLGPGLYDAIIAACQRAGFSPQIGQEAPRMLATLSLVAAGLGATVVPDSMRRLQVEGLAYRRIDDDAGLAATLNLASRRGEAAPAVRQFIATARRIAD